MDLRNSFRQPIQEIHEAARCLDSAVSAHLNGEYEVARDFLYRADCRLVWAWTDSIWGKRSHYTQFRPIAGSPIALPLEQRAKPRMPTPYTKSLIHTRDGYHCRFCQIPVIRDEVRIAIAKAYPDAVPWGSKNALQHAAFQCMWAQYDHIVPHARGGTSDLENVYLTCAACNYGRGSYTLEEVGIAHPAYREPHRGLWDGLERFRTATNMTTMQAAV